MVIGAGDTSEKTARALLSRGAAQRRRGQPFPRPRRGAGAGTGRPRRAVRRLGGEFEKIDIAISSTSAPHHILDRARLEPLMKLRRNRPLLLVDIAVPRDIDPDVEQLDNVYLYNVDDLQAIADDYLQQRQDEIARCEAIIAERVRALLEDGRRKHADDVLRVACCVKQSPEARP